MSLFACIHLNSVFEGGSKLLQNCAASFAPEAEISAPETILIDVSRLSRLYGGPGEIAQALMQHARSLRLDTNVAVAPNAETALLAARNFQGITVISEEAADSIGGLDVGNLPLSPQLWEMLEAWGIRTFQDFARLPESGIAARLGPAGVYLHRLARGTADRPLRVQQPALVFKERADLEHPLDNLEPLLFIISRILKNQCDQLCAHGFSTNELRLNLELEQRREHRRTIRLPVPMRQSQAILKLLQLDLEAHPPQTAILAVTLELNPVQPRNLQDGMYQPVTPAPDKLEVTLARIRALVGEQNAGVPELLNTHRPTPFQLIIQQPATNLKGTRRTPLMSENTYVAFRYFQPPLSAIVQMDGTRPIRLAAGAIRGNVITYAGPWRSSGDWWLENPWNRDEWDVSLNDGAIYRIYRNKDSTWFIEGTYD